MKRPVGRKLLVASLGVAAVSYACSTSETSGNLMPPDPTDADTSNDAGTEEDAFIGSGNLMPPPPEDASGDASSVKDATDEDAFIGSGNLMPPDAE